MKKKKTRNERERMDDRQGARTRGNERWKGGVS